jgi:GntR family transcriptional regulator
VSRPTVREAVNLLKSEGVVNVEHGRGVFVRPPSSIHRLSRSRLPRVLTRGTALEKVDTGPGGAYARLEESGHRIGSFAEHVGARMPTPDEVSALQLPAGVPVVTVTRVAYGTDGVPLEMNDMTLPANLYELSYEWSAD